MDWRIGCSGYQYAEWKGLFYPEDMAKNKWFAFYCEHFNSIELNNTFYRFPRTEFLKKWYANSPDDFCFSVKAPRLITHFKKLKDAQKFLNDFYNAVEQGLQDKAGCVLFQFPSYFAFSEENLERIISILNPRFKNVVEFRHVSWWQEKVFSALSEANICFCGMSHPTLPDTVVKTSNFVYYRFHGVPHLYISRYESEQLEKVASQVVRLGPLDQSFLFFNNTQEGAAISNAKEFMTILDSAYKKMNVPT